MQNSFLIPTIGEMWPTLLVLELGMTVIDLGSLIHVSEFLPQLKRLSTQDIPGDLPPHVRNRVETGYTPCNVAAWRASSFTLVSGMFWASMIEGPDIDVLAQILAMACPNMKLSFRDQAR
ncbi:hypothetical protein FRC06_008386, partial [Ceratobasidium sp. 370]